MELIVVLSGVFLAQRLIPRTKQLIISLSASSTAPVITSTPFYRVAAPLTSSQQRSFATIPFYPGQQLNHRVAAPLSSSALRSRAAITLNHHLLSRPQPTAYLRPSLPACGAVVQLPLLLSRPAVPSTCSCAPLFTPPQNSNRLSPSQQRSRAQPPSSTAVLSTHLSPFQQRHRFIIQILKIKS